MHVIGLTGGIASGKSTVAKLLARRGAEVFDADKIGHAVLDEPAVRQDLVRRWGEEILDSEGRISRTAVADRVFGQSPAADENREFLEQLVHPRIRSRIEQGIRSLPDDAVPAIVIDAALLIESGWNEVCTVVVLVDCPLDIRVRRAAERGWNEAELLRREAAQMPIEQKRRWCQQVIDSSGDLANLEAEVDRFWRAIEGPAK
jgi:dephospho-CoA kinase